MRGPACPGTSPLPAPPRPAPPPGPAALSPAPRRTAKYLEVTCDLGSSSAAMVAVGMVRGLTQALVIDLAVLVESQVADELPEQLLGNVRLDHLDLGEARALDVSRGWSPRLLEGSSPTQQPEGPLPPRR